MIYLVTGGARSGKSTFAEDLALRLCPDCARRCYIATAEPFDDEMKERIAKHRERRGSTFVTVEAPVKLAEAITKASAEYDVILVDCLTVWTNNILYYEKPDEEEKLFTALENVRCDVILVTNETGMGIVPDNALSRRFRDEAGIINRNAASLADAVVLMVCGIPVAVKGAL